MKRWHRLLDGWLVAGVLFLSVLVALLGCTPPPAPRLPPVKPAVVLEPVCTYSSGLAGWTFVLRVSGAYRVRLDNGPYPDIIDYTQPKPGPFTIGGDPNKFYVLTKTVPWVLDYLQNGTWTAVATATAKPTKGCTI